MSYINHAEKSTLKNKPFSLTQKALEPLTEEEKEREAERKNDQDREVQEHIMRQSQTWYSSLSRADLDSKSWANFKIDSEELAEAARYVRAWSPDCDYGIFLYGKPGNGKTHMLKALVIDHFSMDRKFMFRRVSDVMTNMKDFDNREYYHQELMKPYGLVLDDLGTEKASDYEQNELFRILEHRLEARKPVFMTSNLSTTELKAKYSERIISRLGQMMTFVENRAGSHRAKIFRQNQGDLRERASQISYDEMRRLAQEDTDNLIRGSFGE